MPILAASFSLFDKLRCKTVQAEKTYTAAGNKTIRKISLLDKLDNIAAIWGQDAADAETQREELIAQTVAALASDENAFMKAVQIKENKSLLDKVREALKTIIEHVKKFFRDVDAQGRKYGHNIQAQPWLDDLKALEGLAEKFSYMMKAVRENEAAYGARESEVRFEKDETYSLRKYSQKQIDNWSNSSNIVIYKNKNQLFTFINSALKRSTGHKMYFGIIDNKLADFVFSKTGINIKNYNLTLRASEIRKILLNSHGNEANESLRGQRAIKPNDLLSIPKIITEPDDIRLSKKLFEGKPVIEFEKTVNGKTTVVTYVSKKHYDLTVQTVYSGIEKRSLATTPSEKDSRSHTSETLSGTASNTNVSQSSENSNTNSEIQGKKAKNDAFYFDDVKSLKERQNSIVQQNNSMHDDYHTGIRGVEDIYTFEEALGNGEYEEGEDFTPDYTWRMAQRAVSSGKITVYSSYPIKQGVFVTPSKMEAEGYSGSGRTYKKTVALTDVAWIDPLQGQYYSTVYLILLIHSRCYKLLIRSFHQNLYFVSFCF